MNFNLEKIPERTLQPRTNGITMVSDKGLSIADAENLLSVAAPYIDMIKLCFGTGMVTPNLHEKIRLYQSQNVPVFFGGLLFEAFLIRGQLSEFLRMTDAYQISCFEISDGAATISHGQKCAYISEFSKRGTVISEIGSKDKDKIKITPPLSMDQADRSRNRGGFCFYYSRSKGIGHRRFISQFRRSAGRPGK